MSAEDEAGWPTGGPDPEGPYPLSGVRVVSMAEQFPGPFCTLILSDLGADVIQVERPGIGDPSRGLPAFYASLNRNKRSVTADVKTEAGRARLMRLTDAADVFLEGFRPGKLERIGLGWGALSARNPALVYVSISGFGATGPYRDRPAHDITYQGVGGALDERIAGAVSGAPPQLLLGDVLAGLYAAVGVLSALQGRARTGRGAHVDLGMADAVAAAMTPSLAMAEPGAAHPPPPQAEPAFDLFECADGRWLTLSIAHEDAQWRRLSALLGFDAEIGALSRAARTGRRGELKGRIADALRTRERAHWARLFAEADMMWGPANRLAELPEDPQLLARGLFERMTRADGASQWAVRQPLRFSAYGRPPIEPAPELGAQDGSLSDGAPRDDDA